MAHRRGSSRQQEQSAEGLCSASQTSFWEKIGLSNTRRDQGREPYQVDQARRNSSIWGSRKSSRTSIRKRPPLPNINELSEMEINRSFTDYIKESGIKPEKEEEFENLAIDTKKTMLSQHWRVTIPEEGEERFDTPKEYISYLLKKDLSIKNVHDCFQSLRVSLGACNLSWIREFGGDGLQVLVKQLKDCCERKDSRYDEIQLECLRSLRAFMNCTIGINYVFSNCDAMFCIAQSLYCSNEGVVLEALNLLAPVALIMKDRQHHGHHLVITAITESATENGTSHERFAPILHALQHTTKECVRVASLTFINAILDTPRDLDFRQHLRNEFMRAGLEDLIESLQQEEAADTLSRNLIVQLKNFVVSRDQDNDELQLRIANLTLDFENTNACFVAIKKMVKDSPADRHLQSILQHFLSISDKRDAYFELIDECVTQIVLNRDGVDPDPATKRFNINVQPRIAQLVDKGVKDELERKLADTNVKLNDALSKVADLESQGRNQPSGSKVESSPKSPSKGAQAPPPPCPPPPPGPPPPPMMGGQISALAVPLPFGLAPKKRWSPGQLCTALHWNVIPPKKMSEDSVWLILDEDNIGTENPQILEDLEEKFAAKQYTAAPKKMTKRIKKQPFLDEKTHRLTGVALSGGGLKEIKWEIKEYIWRCDTTSLTEDIVETLIKLLPADEVWEAIKQMRASPEYESQVVNMDDAELFFLQLAEIDHLPERLDSILILHTFYTITQELEYAIHVAELACKELTTSSNFHAILELILLFGNYINARSPRGRAFGFDLTFLTKLVDVKDTTSSSNLLHFLEETIHKYGTLFPGLGTFRAELKNVEKATTLTLQPIANARVIEDLITKLKINLKKFAKPQNPEDKCFQVLSEFLKIAQGESENIKKRAEDLENIYKDLAEFYSFDLTKYKPMDFFGDIKKFVIAFSTAQQENIKKREKAEHARLTEERRLLNELPKEALDEKKMAVCNLNKNIQEGNIEKLAAVLAEEKPDYRRKKKESLNVSNCRPIRKLRDVSTAIEDIMANQ